MHRLKQAKSFIETNNRMLYADGYAISWDLVDYMNSIGKIFLPIIDAADSDCFMVSDSLYTLIELLTSLLKFKPEEQFTSSHRELIMSTLDYLVGNVLTGRKIGKNDIKSRAEPFTILGLFFDIEHGCQFKFTEVRAAVKTSVENGVLHQDDMILVSFLLQISPFQSQTSLLQSETSLCQYETSLFIIILQLNTIFDRVSLDWTETVEATAKSLLKKLSSDEVAPVATPSSTESDHSQDLFNTAFTEEDDFEDDFGMRSRFLSKIMASKQPESQPDILREIAGWRGYDFNKYTKW